MGRFDHVAFQVGNMDVAIQFYVEKLGFALSSRAVNQEEEEEFVFLTLGDVRLELIHDLSQAAHPKPGIQPPYCPHLAIRTDNMERTLARLREKDVSIIRGPLVIEDEVTWVYFSDPDNNVLEYVQWYK